MKEYDTENKADFLKIRKALRLHKQKTEYIVFLMDACAKELVYREENDK